MILTVLRAQCTPRLGLSLSVPTREGRAAFGTWLLGVAALCLVAQSTLLRIAAPWASVWDPAHVHVTLGGTVPAHEHVYRADRSTEPGCRVPPDDGTVSAGADDDQLACAANASGATSAVTALSVAPADIEAGGGSLERPVHPVPSATWHSAVLDVLTPPPRTLT